MSIVKPFTFVAGTKARANEVNEDFDVLYSQVNSNISNIAQNEVDIDNLDLNKANINGDSTKIFNVADATINTHAINKQTMMKYITNTLNYISGLTIEKDSNSPDDTILVNPGSCYDSTFSTVLSLESITSKQNLNQGASTTYYVYIIGNSTGSSIDILISPLQVTPTLPTGYTLYRQIGNYKTDSSSKINSISYYGIDSGSDKSANYNAYSSAAAPDYSSAFSISRPWTATANGYVYIYGRAVEGNTYLSITIGGITMPLNGFLTNREGGHAPGGIFPIKKGDYMTASGWVESLVFIPCVGG